MNRIKYDHMIARFKKYLENEEKSTATIEKYLRDVRCFFTFLENRLVSKEAVISYKNFLKEKYAPSSVNSMLVALNCALRFLGMPDFRVKLIKIQRQLFISEKREMNENDYQNLIKAASGTRISYIIQTICGTGVRVSELRYITVEAVQKGRAEVTCKNKTRVIFLSSPVQSLLRKYIKKSGIDSGPVFVSKNGKPLNRSNIWREMKRLCEKSGVNPGKVFPHNLRHLFARTFYSIEKDIVILADLLGHSSIDTTRIYTMETGSRHISRLEHVQKLLIT